MSLHEPRFSPILLVAAVGPLLLGVAIFWLWTPASTQPIDRERVPARAQHAPADVELPPPEWLATWHTPDFEALETQWQRERQLIDRFADEGQEGINLTRPELELWETYRLSRAAVAATVFLEADPPTDREVAAFRQQMRDHYRLMGEDGWRRLAWNVYYEFRAAIHAYFVEVAALNVDPLLHVKEAERSVVAELYHAAGDFLVAAQRYELIGDDGMLYMEEGALALLFLEWWLSQVDNEVRPDQFLSVDEIRALRLWQLAQAPHAPLEQRYDWWREVEERTGSASPDPEPLVRATLLFQAGDLNNARRTLRGWVERQSGDPRANAALEDIERRMSARR